MKIDFGDPIDFEIPIADFPLLSLPIKSLAGRSEIKVFMLKSVHDQMIDHVNLDKHIECGGVLVGYPFQDRETEEIFVVIVGVIPDLSNNRSIVHFTVTPDEISRTRDVLEKKFPSLIAVGWYHSHPGHGVFLSGQDMTIVRGIYNELWNLAWVIDPIRGNEGIFYGPNGDPLVSNKSSNSLHQKTRVWISLTEYPRCVKDLQSGKADYVKKGPTPTPVFSQPKAKNKIITSKPYREEIAARRKQPWVWVLLVLFISALFLMGASLIVSSLLISAIIISSIAMLMGLYILIWLMVVTNGIVFTKIERFIVLFIVISIPFIWGVELFANYKGFLRFEIPTLYPISTIQPEPILPTVFTEIPSATPVVVTPTSVPTLTPTTINTIIP